MLKKNGYFYLFNLTKINGLWLQNIPFMPKNNKMKFFLYLCTIGIIEINSILSYHSYCRIIFNTNKEIQYFLSFCWRYKLMVQQFHWIRGMCWFPLIVDHKRLLSIIYLHYNIIHLYLIQAALKSIEIKK